METITFIAVLGSAFLHATWNVTGKKVAHILPIPWLGFFCASLCLSPVLLSLQHITIDWKPALLITIGSTLIHSIYILSLFYAYEKWDIAIIYPIVRGSSVMICAITSLFIFKEDLTILGMIGIGFIIIGILIKAIHLLLFSKTYHLKDKWAIPIALFVGTLVGAYLIIDSIAIHYIPPLQYVVLLNILMGLTLMPYMIIKKRPLIRTAIIQYKRYIALIGFASLTSYLLILYVFLNSTFGYAASLREISILFAAGFAYFLLKEKITKLQWVAILCLIIGASFIKLG